MKKSYGWKIVRAFFGVDNYNNYNYYNIELKDKNRSVIMAKTIVVLEESVKAKGLKI